MYEMLYKVIDQSNCRFYDLSIKSNKSIIAHIKISLFYIVHMGGILLFFPDLNKHIFIDQISIKDFDYWLDSINILIDNIDESKYILEVLKKFIDDTKLFENPMQF